MYIHFISAKAERGISDSCVRGDGHHHAIVFDGYGWGYYLFDNGVTFSTQHEALIDTFIAGRLMCHVLWLAAHVKGRRMVCERFDV